MNLLDAATTIATTSDIEGLFAIYSQSRAYARGEEVRAQIEARVDEIAVLNDYEEDFSSFRELVERYDNDNSPLWDFVSSDAFLVTDTDHPLPYTIEEFLNLFRRIYERSGLVVIGYNTDRGQRMEPYVKYRLLKTESGLTFIKRGRVDKEIKGNYDEEFVSKLPAKFTKQLFGKNYGFCTLRFANDFYQMVDFFASAYGEEIEVYHPLTEEGLLEPILFNESNDGGIYESKTIYSTSFEHDNEEKTLTFNYNIVLYSGWGPGEDDRRPQSEREEYDFLSEPYFKMLNPLPYIDLPRYQRYSAYLLLIQFQFDEIPFDLQWYQLPLEDGENYACYDSGDDLYMAVERLLTEEEIELIEDEDMEVSYEGSFGQFHFYTLHREGDEEI